jgi:polyisoprenoid-binding protein YceI
MRSHCHTRRMPARCWPIGQALLVASAAALTCCPGARAARSAESWRIDDAHTLISFKIDAVGFPTTHGRFTHYSGRVHLDFEHPAKGLTMFTVDSNSVDVGSPSFTDFVKGVALLNVARFPTLRFVSTRVEKLDWHTAHVIGDLTMLGVTKPLTLAVNVDSDPSTRGRIVALLATGTIRRSEFGMVFGLPLISDTVELAVKTRALTDE